MENLWAILCRSAYADGEQHTKITDMKAAIISSLEMIEVCTLQKFVGTMCDRAFSNNALSLIIKMSWLYNSGNTSDMLKDALCVNSRQ
jgi:hypothetical protein